MLNFFILFFSCLFQDTNVLSDFRERHYSEQQLQEKLKNRTGPPVELPKLDTSHVMKNEPMTVHSAPPYGGTLMFRSIAEEKEPSFQSEENDEFHMSSTESLHELQHLGRKRTISGNYSERSTSSSREVTYIKSIHEHQNIGQESRIFFTTGNGFISVSSVIPWQKVHPRQHNAR